jgi:hypothetical protein
VLCCQCPCVVPKAVPFRCFDCNEVPMCGASVPATTASCNYTCSMCYLLYIGSATHCINKHACASILNDLIVSRGWLQTLAASLSVIGVRSQSILHTNLHPSTIHTAQVATLPMLHTTMLPMKPDKQHVKGKIVSKRRCAAPVTTTTMRVGKKNIYHQ